jgi:hypothetical protein
VEIKELLQYLTLAELHVGDGQRQIVHQRALIRKMEQDGADTTACKALLSFLVQTQVEQRADRDKIILEIVKLGKPKTGELE